MKLLIYIPALDEEKSIGDVIEHLPKRIEGIRQIEVLVVDDGSTDGTVGMSKRNGARVVSHGFNRGVGRAFRTAVQYALENKFDVLVSIDADRQFNTEQIPTMIQPILEDRADMVTGNRFKEGIPANMSKIKYWGNGQMSQLISLISGQKFRDVSCGFRAYNRESLLRLNLFGDFTYTQESILDMVYKDLRVVDCPIDVRYFKERRSRVAGSVINYSFKTLKIILRTLRDYKPMLFFGGMGVVSLFIGLSFEVILFTRYFIQGMFSPYKSLGFIGLGFGIFGMLLVIVGLLADMFNRGRQNQERILYEIKKENYSKFKKEE